MERKVISIASACWNEVENIPLFYDRCMAVLKEHPEYDYEFIVEDNLSTDGTREVLREIAAKDPKFKVILNANNFGHIRSPFNCLLNASGDVVLYICSDLQEPPEVLHKFLEKYHEGYKVVCGVRADTKSSKIMEFFRGIYYSMLQKFATNQKVIRKFTGFGLYDKCFIEALRKFHEPYPYFRGLVSEIGFKQCEVPFVQEARLHCESKNNFFTLYDMAAIGFIHHSKLPLRLAVMCGGIMAVFCIITALIYLIFKCIYWETFQMGMAPVVIGMFFFMGVQLLFIGILGEYLGAVWTQVRNKPLVIEEERINF